MKRQMDIYKNKAISEVQLQ